MPRLAIVVAVIAVVLDCATAQGIFDAFFNGQQQRQRGRGGKPRGNDNTVELNVELSDVYTGAMRNAALAGLHEICGDCKGTGARGGKTKRCSTCNGQGQVSKPMRMGQMMVQMQQPCSDCGGKGVTYKHKCSTCGGAGIVQKDKNLECTIEAGMKSDDTIVFKNQADIQNPDMDPGNLIFKLNVNEQGSKLKRESVGFVDDLHLTEHITLKEALLGYEHQITHLDHHKVNFGHRGITQPYQVRRIQGEGMPIRGQPRRFGDLFIEHRIRFPKSVNERQKQVLLDAFGGWPKAKADTIICAAPPCTLTD